MMNFEFEETQDQIISPGQEAIIGSFTEEYLKRYQGIFRKAIKTGILNFDDQWSNLGHLKDTLLPFLKISPSVTHLICPRGYLLDSDINLIKNIIEDPDTGLSVLSLQGVNSENIKPLIESLKKEAFKIRDLKIEYWGEFNPDENAIQYDLSSIPDLLKTNQGLESLTLSFSGNDKGYNDQKVHEIAKALVDPRCNLSTLILRMLRNNDIGDEGIAFLVKALKNPNCKLTSLDLSFVDLSKEGAESLATALEDPNCKLTKLNLNSNFALENHLSIIVKALKNPNCKLQDIDLSDIGLADEDVEALTLALNDPNCKLTHLNLRATKLSEKGLDLMAQAIGNPNCKLKAIDLSYTRFDNDAGLEFAKQLSNNDNIESLTLGVTHLTNPVASRIGEALKKPSCKINFLDLQSNVLYNVDNILNALKEPTCPLTILNLRGKQLTEHSDFDDSINMQSKHFFEKLSTTLQDSHCKLVVLGLDYIPYPELFEQVLQKNQSLIAIPGYTLGDDYMGKKIKIKESLQRNRQLRETKKAHEIGEFFAGVQGKNAEGSMAPGMVDTMLLFSGLPLYQGHVETKVSNEEYESSLNPVDRIVDYIKMVEADIKANKPINLKAITQKMDSIQKDALAMGYVFQWKTVPAKGRGVVEGADYKRIQNAIFQLRENFKETPELINPIAQQFAEEWTRIEDEYNVHNSIYRMNNFIERLSTELKKEGYIKDTQYVDTMISRIDARIDGILAYNKQSDHPFEENEIENIATAILKVKNEFNGTAELKNKIVTFLDDKLSKIKEEMKKVKIHLPKHD